jgi:TonB family protein
MKILILALACLTGGAALASGIDHTDPMKDERRPLRIIQTTPIVYPNNLLLRGIVSGAARVAIAMDNTGTLTDVLVVGYTHEEFGQAAEDAVRAWSYEPIRIRAEHVATQAVVTFNFEAKGVVVNIDATTDLSLHVHAFRSANAYAPCPLHRLDAIPAPLVFLEPAYSRDLKDHGIEGQTVIEFYIDENGSVRVPAVLDADFWELGVLAMEAVRNWKFAPPTSNGRPVLVRVRQAFVFGKTDGLSVTGGTPGPTSSTLAGNR